MRTISDDDSERQGGGPSKLALRNMLKEAVLNTNDPKRVVRHAASPAATPPSPKYEPPPAARAEPMAQQTAEPIRRRKHEDIAAGGMRAIDARKLTPVTFETKLGDPPELQYLPIASLFVDDRYQRNVLEVGLANVYRIAREFDWRKFAPVIVARVEHRYAVVDGQHRCYAAALRGIRDVPCMVIDASLSEQASAFAAINGKVTRISELHVYAAAVIARDPDALQLDTVCRSATIEVCRYPVPESKMKPRQTLAIGMLRQCLKMYGDKVLLTALRCIVKAHPSDVGVLRAPIIRAMSDVIAALDHQHVGKAIGIAAKINFIDQLARARLRAAAQQRAVRLELFDALSDIFEGRS